MNIDISVDAGFYGNTRVSKENTYSIETWKQDIDDLLVEAVQAARRSYGITGQLVIEE